MLRLAVFALLLPLPAAAQVSLDGWLIARQDCEAFQSKNAMTNPGDVRLTPRTAYDMIGINKTGGEWYQVRVPGAPVTEARWVLTSCGIHAVAAAPGPSPATPPPFTPPAGTTSTDNLLALSWQPAFCEGKPSKAECRQLNAGQLPVTETQLSLHGLWPQPQGVEYCGVPEALKAADRASDWDALPAPDLDADTAERLAVAMPGTASRLERHEWIKHGTCFFAPGGADGYFDDMLAVTVAINASPVGALLASHVGASLDTADLRAAFDAAFGAGAGQRVQVQCAGDGGRVLVTEIRIALKGAIIPEADLGALIRAAAPQSPGCPEGVIDPAGLQ